MSYRCPCDGTARLKLDLDRFDAPKVMKDLAAEGHYCDRCSPVLPRFALQTDSIIHKLPGIGERNIEGVYDATRDDWNRGRGS